MRLGPWSSSIRSAVRGLMVTAWSGSEVDRSRLLIPSTSTGARAPCSPRRIGRDADGPKLDALTPGMSASMSPRPGFMSWVSSLSSRTATPPRTWPACACGSRNDDRLLFVMLVGMAPAAALPCGCIAGSRGGWRDGALPAPSAGEKKRSAPAAAPARKILQVKAIQSEAVASAGLVPMIYYRK